MGRVGEHSADVLALQPHGHVQTAKAGGRRIQVGQFDERIADRRFLTTSEQTAKVIE